jgi:hypothetical protein
MIFFPHPRTSLQTLAQAGSHYRQVRKRLFILACFWFLFHCLQISIAGNIPLLGLLGIGKIVGHSQYGISSLNGFLNAILLVISNYSFLSFLETRKKSRIVIYLFCLFWPILAMTRQVLISQIMQSVFIFMFFKRRKDLQKIQQLEITSDTEISTNSMPQKITKPKNISWFLKLTLFVVVFLFVFGLLGDFRLRNVPGIHTWAKRTENYPSFLPDTLLWGYLYITSPLSNVAHNFQEVEPMYIPIETLRLLTPSIFKEQVSRFSVYDWELYVGRLNQSSFHITFLMDFGVYGALVAYFIIGTIAQFVYRKAILSKNVCWQFVCSVVLYDIVISVFTNYFFSPVFLAEIFLHILLQYKIQIIPQTQDVTVVPI